MAMRADVTRSELGDDYDPFDAAHVADPYAFYQRARVERPVFFSPALDAWVVTRHDDVQAVLKDHHRFMVAIYGARTASHTPEALAILRETPITGRSLLLIDPPEHTRLRAIISRTLSAQRSAALEPRVRPLSARLIDELRPLGRTDFMAGFANPFPILVIGSLLDVPEADFPRLLRWSNDRTTLLFADVAPEDQPALARSSLALERYILEMAERRRHDLGDDLASDLIRSAGEGETPLDPMEVAATLRLLLVAGFETTIKLLGNTMLRLLSDRRLWLDVVDHPERIPDVVEESLRLDGPVLSTMRTAREEVEVGGVTIPEGAMVHLVTGSANRDEAVFADAAGFHPEREWPAPHLAFGYGIHFCVGAPLARLEMRIALEQLGERLPSLRLAPDRRVEYDHGLLLRGPRQLWLEWDA
jgi:cytochrome P450